MRMGLYAIATRLPYPSRLKEKKKIKQQSKGGNTRENVASQKGQRHIKDRCTKRAGQSGVVTAVKGR